MNEDKDLVVSCDDEVSKRRLIKQELMEAIGPSDQKLGSARLNPIVKLVRLPEQNISAFLKPTRRTSSRERKPTVKYVIEDAPIVNKRKQNRSAMDKAIKKKTPVVKPNRSKREKSANKKETPPSCTMSLRARKITRYIVENSDSEEDSQGSVLIPYKRCNSSVSSSTEETPDPSSNEAPSDSVSETSENEEEKCKISEYELQVQKNIEERKKMFEMLRIKDAKKELTNIL